MLFDGVVWSSIPNDANIVQGAPSQYLMTIQQPYWDTHKELDMYAWFRGRRKCLLFGFVELGCGGLSCAGMGRGMPWYEMRWHGMAMAVDTVELQML